MQRLRPAGDVVEHELGDIRVAAHDHEHRRREAAKAGFGVLLPTPERLLVVSVEAVKSALQLGGQLRLAADGVGLAPFPGQVLSNAQPQVAISRLVARHRVVRHRHARHLDDATLNGVDKREVGHDPGEQRAFRITGALEEEGRCRKIVDRPDANLVLDRFQARQPHARFLVAFFGFAALITSQHFRVGVRLPAIAVMRFVVDHDNVPLASEIAAHAAHNLIGRLGKQSGLALRENCLREPCRVAVFARKKRVIVGDENSRLAKPVQQVRRKDVALLVVVVRIGRQQHAQAVTNCDAGRDEQERV